MTTRADRSAFTLIELLVVVAIIALLISILLPALGKAKENGRRAVCLSNLHHLGQAFQQYLHDNADRLPAACFLPSVESLDPNGEPYEPITAFMEPYVKNLELFHCPSDMPGWTRRDPADPNKVNKSYWQTEGTSYEYTSIPRDADYMGKLLDRQGYVDVADTVVEIGPIVSGEEHRHPWHHSGMSTADMFLLKEYEIEGGGSYHGKRGDSDVINTLYADCHVEEYHREIRDPD